MNLTELNRHQAGFSLIELMIVVAIIGVLSTIAVPNMSEGIKKNLARNHAKSLLRSMSALRIKDDGNQTLGQVAGSGCSFCEAGLGAGSDMRTFVPNAAYITQWRALGFDNPPRDPWGHYYILDENEGDFADCRMDSVWSAGADAIWEGPGDGDDVGGDDQIGRLPWINITCAGEDPRTGGY